MRQAGQSKKMAEARLSFEERKTIFLSQNAYTLFSFWVHCIYIVYKHTHTHTHTEGIHFFHSFAPSVYIYIYAYIYTVYICIYIYIYI
jgi:hypothetical protein